MFKEAIETLADRSFFALFISSIASAAHRFTAALTFVMLTYLGLLLARGVLLDVAGGPLSADGTMDCAPGLKTLGQERGAALGVLAFTVQPLPVLFRLLAGCPRMGIRFCSPSLLP